MSEYQETVTSSWNQQMRRIRFRRRRENLHLWTEFKLVPRWLKVTLAVIFLVSQGLLLVINIEQARIGEPVIPELHDHPVLSGLAVAGIAMGAWLALSLPRVAVSGVSVTCAVSLPDHHQRSVSHQE